MKKIVAIVAIIVVLGAAAGVYFGYNSYYEELGKETPTAPTVEFLNNLITPHSAQFSYIVPIGEPKQMTYEYEVPGGLILGGADTVLDITVPQGEHDITVMYDGAQFFSGTAQQLADTPLAGTGLYSISITYSPPDTEQSGGSFNYAFDYELILPAEVTHTSLDILQGEAVTVNMSNIPADTPLSVTAEGLETTLITGGDGEYSAMIIAGYLKEAGSYPAQITVGDEVTDITVNVGYVDFEVQSFNVDPGPDTAASNAEYREVIYPLYDTKDPMRYWEGTFILPTEGRYTSGFGLIRYINGEYSRHAGIDIAAAEDTPIIAPNHGRIEYAGFLMLSGNTVVIDHGGGLKSYMFHLYDIDVQTGDIVSKGDLIGGVGTTGFSTGNHLHYQLQVGRDAIDPWIAFDNKYGLFEPVEGE